MNRLLVTLALAALPLSLHAQVAPVLPGLWEFTSRSMQIDGQQMPDINELLGQMQNLPDDQRKMMEDLLAAQGVQLGGQGIRICLSEAQLDADSLPFSDQEDCTQEITEQSERLWRFRFQCPETSGEGETRFVSPREFTSVLDARYHVDGEQGTSRMEYQARWISDDCGTLKPAR